MPVVTCTVSSVPKSRCIVKDSLRNKAPPTGYSTNEVLVIPKVP